MSRGVVTAGPAKGRDLVRLVRSPAESRGSGLRWPGPALGSAGPGDSLGALPKAVSSAGHGSALWPCRSCPPPCRPFAPCPRLWLVSSAPREVLRKRLPPKPRPLEKYGRNIVQQHLHAHDHISTTATPRSMFMCSLQTFLWQTKLIFQKDLMHLIISVPQMMSSLHSPGWAGVRNPGGLWEQKRTPRPCCSSASGLDHHPVLARSPRWSRPCSRGITGDVPGKCRLRAPRSRCPGWGLSLQGLSWRGKGVPASAPARR